MSTQILLEAIKWLSVPFTVLGFVTAGALAYGFITEIGGSDDSH